MQQLIDAQPEIYKQFVQLQQDKLNLITSRKQNNFHEDSWQFFQLRQDCNMLVDFSIYENDFMGSDSVLEIIFSRQSLSLSQKEFAKVLWLDSVVGSKCIDQSYKAKFEVLCLLFSFLNEEGTIINSAAGVLTGNFVEDHDLLNYEPLSSQPLTLVRDITSELFIKRYNKLSSTAQVFKLDTVNKIIEESGLPDRFDSQEFVSSLLIGLYIGHFEKRPELIFHEYVSAIKSEGHVFKFSFDEFCDLSHSIIDSNSYKLTSNKKSLKNFLTKKAQQAPQSPYACNSGSHAFQRKLNSITLYVESAGVVLFLGLTGWRRSEYGFPLSAIEVSINNDILDNLYTPWRFHVNWLVPKTSGTTPLQREITSYAYQVAFFMDKLNLSDSNNPALYLITPKVKKYWNSGELVSNRVDLLWGDFVENYSFFTDLKNIEILSKKVKLNNSEKTSLKLLRQKYDPDSSQVKMLIQMKAMLEESLPRFQLICGNDDKKLGNRLKKYLAGDLEEYFVNILEKSISSETLEKLKSGEFELNAATTRYVRNELLANDVYPTPHAFRHIWAEAVLLRYRGDVGKFIRANFKHLDERFFMSYLRNKETKVVYQVAKRTIINSIVRQQIMSITDNSRKFAGGFDRFLSKAVKLTKVVTLEQLEDLASRISEQRVIDIKSNPWAICILRIGTEKTAKCSEDGVPQRRNAEPKLCLGCVNADIADGNFNGIVVYIKYDIAACRNPKLPAFIKEPHIQTVKIALKRVEELRRNSNNPKYDKFISYLHETLEMSFVCTEIA